MKDLGSDNFAVIHRWIHHDDADKTITLKNELPQQ